MSETTIRHEVIELPSKGLLYSKDNALNTGTVDLKYSTAAEEDILTSTTLIKNKTVIDKFLQAIILTPGVNFNEILIGDKNALAFAARIMAFGENYSVKIKCTSCGALKKDIINLNTLENKNIDYTLLESGENSFEFKLPISGDTITIKLLTHQDIKEIENTIQNYKKLGKDSNPKEVTTRLRKTITSVNGDSDFKTISKYVFTIPSQDSYAIRQFIESITPDVDTNYNFICDECGYEEVIDIPIDVEFFWPSSRL